MSFTVCKIFITLAIAVVCTPASATDSYGEGTAHGGGWGHTEVKGHDHGWGHKEVKGQGWNSNYKFGYGVGDEYTGDWKSAYESRQNGWTKGSYSVLQPDGILRTVNYEADPWNGFKATVHNKGWTKPKSHGWGQERGHEKSTNGWSNQH